MDEEYKTVMQCIGEPSEITKVAVFLASSASSNITGTTVCGRCLTLVS